MQCISPTAFSSSFNLVVFTNSIDVWKWQLIPDANWQSPVATTIFPLPPSSASLSADAMSWLSHAGILFKNAGASWLALAPCPTHTAYFGAPIPSMAPPGVAASEVATAEALGGALVMAGAPETGVAFVFGGGAGPPPFDPNYCHTPTPSQPTAFPGAMFAREHSSVGQSERAPDRMPRRSMFPSP